MTSTKRTINKIESFARLGETVVERLGILTNLRCKYVFLQKSTKTMSLLNLSRFSVLLLFLSLTWTCSSTKSAQKINSGIVQYDIELDLTEEGKDMAETFGNSATAWFNQSHVRLQKKSELPDDEFYITNLETGLETAYIQFKDQKYAVLPDPRLLPATGPIQFSEETKTIAGHICRKATATMGSGEMVVYFSEDFGLNYCPYLDLAGFALEYTLVLPFGNVTYRARAVQKGGVSDGMVNPPLGFKKVSYTQFQEEMKANISSSVVTEGDYKFQKSSLDGTLINLSDYLGQVVVLNFWFTACPPCKREIPELNRLVSQYKDQGVQFLAITYDQEELVRPFLEQYPFDFTILPNAHDVIKDFEIIVYPTTIVLDKNGKIVNMIMGGGSTIHEKASALIEEAKKR